MTEAPAGTAYMLPEVIPHQPSDGAGPDDPIVFATDLAGNPVGFAVAGTDCPHMLIAGATGTGTDGAIRLIVLEAARRGIDVRFCCPKPVAAAGLEAWPNITVASTAQEMAGLIDRTYTDMMTRYTEIEEDRAGPWDYPRILLAVDEYLLFTLLVSDWWERVRVDLSGQQPKEHPAMGQARALLAMARGARINVLAATLSASGFPADLRDNFGMQLALGRPSAQAAQAMFGDATAGRDVPHGTPGAGTALTSDGLARVQVHWLPDPGRPSPLGPEEAALLQAMLPPGTESAEGGAE